MLYAAGGEIMLKIAVLDDEPVFLSEFTAFLHQLTAEHETTNIDSFTDSSAFLQSPEQYDLIFLDIDMKLSNGMEAAKRLRKIDGQVALIFETQLAQYAVEGYLVDAVGYLVKPIEYYALSLVMTKAL